MHDALISAILLFFALKTTTNYSLYHCVSQRVILTIIYTGIFLNYKISTAKEDSTSEGRYFKRAHHCCVISKLVLKRGKTEIGYRFPYRVSTTECLTTTFSQNSSSILAVDILLFQSRWEEIEVNDSDIKCLGIRARETVLIVDQRDRTQLVQHWRLSFQMAIPDQWNVAKQQMLRLVYPFRCISSLFVAAFLCFLLFWF